MSESENFPKTIGRYEIKRLLGSGAMGSVYLAEDPRIKRKLAIKVVKLDTMRSEVDRQEFLARFQREAEVSGVLNDPGIVTIYDVGDSELGPFLAMEFVQGKPLDSILKSGEVAIMPLRTKLQIISNVASALDHAHAHGIVHRDVKPGNVMITEDGRPKLMDFGIAKREDATLTQTGTFLGTPSYASPEQIKEGHASPLSDIFSFGVMVFELLAGVLPFPGSSINTILYKIVNEPPMEVQPPVTGLMPESWLRIFNRVLAKNPQERYPTCSAFTRELIECTTELDNDTRLELLGLSRPGGGTAPPRSSETFGGPPLPPRSAETFGGSLIPPTPTVRIQASDHLPASPVSHSSKGLIFGSLAIAAVIVGLGAFLFSGKGGEAVTVTTEPSGAIILLNGQPLDPTKPLIMKAGDHLQIKKSGFKTTEYTHQAKDTAPTIKLEAEVKEVLLQTDPPGAKVVIDTKEVGATPLKYKWNWGKDHHVTFTNLAKGLAESRDFDPGAPIEDIEKIVVLAPLTEQKATAEVKTIDPNALGILRFAGEFSVRVRVDGKDMGEVAKVSLPPGDHKLDLSNSRVFFKETRNVTVKPEQTTSVPLPGLAQLTISTFPNSGMVVIDGTPTEVESDGDNPIPVAKGRHTVSIKDYPGSSRSVNVERGEQLFKFKL